MRKTIAAAGALLAGLLPAAPAQAWGFTAHRMVNSKAVAALPAPLAAFFAANAAYLAEHSIDPDLERSGPSDPDHFLDMDSFGEYPFARISRVEAEHLARFGADARAKGRVPWRAGEVFGELVAAFRAGDAALALDRAAALGHFVGDAHVPLHSATNYDGQLSGQHGLHGRWESELVARFERQIDAAATPAAARAASDATGLVFEALLESYREYAPGLEADLAARGPADYAATAEDDRYGDAYYSRLYERQGATLARRLARAAKRVASLWLGAWLEAGRPALDASFRLRYVRRRTRAILVSLDGSAAPLIDDAVARGVMPELGRLRARGAAARGALTAPIAKTAAGHAALWTGSWGDGSGITGNTLPVQGAAASEQVSGYSSTPLVAEPIWVTAARQGLEVTVVSAPQVYPFSPYLRERRFGGDYGRNLTLLDGYQNLAAFDRVLTEADLRLAEPSGWLGPLPPHRGDARELALDVSGVRVDGLLLDDPEDPADGLDTLYLTLDKDPRGGVTLKPLPALGADASAFAALSLPLLGPDTAVFFRLFALSPDGGRLLLYQAAPHAVRSNKPPVEAALRSATGGFVGNGASHAYERGRLGRTLAKGGDGEAERRYLETVALVARQFELLNDFAIERTPWQLLLTYLPYPDEAFHAWLGYLDARLPGHDAALAARLRPFLDEVLRSVDRYLARLLERAGPDTVIAVAADHGQLAVARSFRPNVALREAGLLALREDGSIDLSRTRALYHSGGSSLLLVNRADRPGGIVSKPEEAEVRRAAAAALLAARDPRNGAPVVAAVREAADAGVGAGGADLFLEPAPGYALSAATTGPAVAERAPGGDHIGTPALPGMHAIFVLAGPGVAPGADLGVIRQIDVAPTLCALLGLQAPAQSQGRVLGAALLHPR